MSVPATVLRMHTLPDNPGVARDSHTGANYHLESSLEALALCELVNGYEERLAMVQVQLDNLNTELQEAKDALFDCAVETDLTQNLDGIDMGEEETHG